MMKNLFYSFIVLLAFLTTMQSCKKMDDTYKDFLVPGGKDYPEKVNNALAFSGYNRIKIAWNPLVDPSVSFIRIFWNNYQDSVQVDVKEGSGEVDSVVLNNLKEGSYSFFIRTYDDNGNQSVEEEVYATVYGNSYITGLLPRSISDIIVSVSKKNKDSVIIKWGSVPEGGLSTNLYYYSRKGERKKLEVPNTNEKSIISDIDLGKTVSRISFFKPDSTSIDTFSSDTIQYKDKITLDKSPWSVVGYSSLESGDDNVASNLIDGKPSTRWVSNTSDELPQYITVDMKRVRTITDFKIWRSEGDDRAVDSFLLEVSKDGENWDNLGRFSFDRKTDEGQLYNIPSKPRGRYWKFIGIAGPESFVLMGEVSVFGY